MNSPTVQQRRDLSPQRGGQSLVDVLDRVLEKGLVVAGDIRINLADVELLTIQIRLLICSIDKAEEIGLDWWRTDPRMSTEADGDRRALSSSLDSLQEKLDALDSRLNSLEERAPGD